jgi:ketose-bisphosphate aldolase
LKVDPSGRRRVHALKNILQPGHVFMPRKPFKDLLAEAERGQYAVGYFESWNLESLQAVAEAAEATRSPVFLGFSGIHLCDDRRRTRQNLAVYAAFGNEICNSVTVPACLIFNECPQLEQVLEAIHLGFGMVMFSNGALDMEAQSDYVAQLVAAAHPAGVQIEAEMAAVPGMGGELTGLPPDKHFTDPALAQAFVERTGVDALAVNIGQAHMHGRVAVRLDMARLAELKKAVSVPLVLHGGTSVSRSDLQAAIRLGIRKVNIGSILKRSYFAALRSAIAEITDNEFNPYEVIGSGLEKDVLDTASNAVRKVVEDLMVLFGSAGKT